MGILDKIYHFFFEDKENYETPNFDLKTLKENLGEKHEKDAEGKTKKIVEEEIRGITLIIPSYTVNPNILPSKKSQFYWNITCCKSCWFCFDSPGRSYRCVKHNIKNHFNGCCDDYRYNKMQLPE
jgi:hypothetical protein